MAEGSGEDGALPVWLPSAKGALHISRSGVCIEDGLKSTDAVVQKSIQLINFIWCLVSAGSNVNV